MRRGFDKGGNITVDPKPKPKQKGNLSTEPISPQTTSNKKTQTTCSPCNGTFAVQVKA